MSKQVAIIEHTDHPEWGRGVVLALEGARPDRLDISFEKGGRRTILKSFSAKLLPVSMGVEEAQQLGERLSSRRSATAPRAGTPVKKKSGSLGAPAFATFDSQLKAFLAMYPGGFRGEKFEKTVRGLPEAKRKKTDTGPAIAAAAAAFGEGSFANAAAVFEAMTELVRSTSFVHPLEGANLLGTMKDAHRPELVAALEELLHGTHDAGDRFDRFVSAIKLEDASGAVRRPSWPLATMFAALVHPTAHVCVKPTYFQKQAALLSVPLDYQPLPSSAVYAQFLTVVRKTQEALLAAAQAPRDLVDVASFICLTQGAKPEKA
jgi:hypothetical protein